MTNEQIQSRAIELFNQYGPNRNRAALNELYNEVFASGRHFDYKVSPHFVIDNLAWAVYPTPDFLKNDIDALNSVIGETVTIVKSNSFGFVSKFVCKLEKVSVRNYAQYDNLIKIQYREKRKRTSYTFFVENLTQIAVYKGEVEVNTNTQSKVIKQSNDVTITCLGAAFDEKHFTGAVASIKQNPIFIKDIKQY